MELHEAGPGLVVQDVVAEVTDLFHDLADVVDRAVVGGQLDTGETEGALGLVTLGVLHQRVGADLLAEVLLVPCVPIHRADHAESIA